MTKLQLTVNGRPHTLDIPDNRYLAELLRYDLRLTGTKTAATTYSAISLGIAAGFQILTGRLCDRIGRWKPVFISSSCVTISAVGLAGPGPSRTMEACPRCRSSRPMRQTCTT